MNVSPLSLAWCYSEELFHEPGTGCTSIQQTKDSTQWHPRPSFPEQCRNRATNESRGSFRGWSPLGKVLRMSLDVRSTKLDLNSSLYHKADHNAPYVPVFLLWLCRFTNPEYKKSGEFRTYVLWLSLVNNAKAVKHLPPLKVIFATGAD